MMEVMQCIYLNRVLLNSALWCSSCKKEKHNWLLAPISDVMILLLLRNVSLTVFLILSPQEALLF